MRPTVKVLFVVVAGVLCSGVWSEAAADRTVLVVPARHAIVRLAFDVASLKKVTLVSYSVPKRSNVPALFVWDKSVQQWIQIATQDFADGAVFPEKPDRVIVVGDDSVGTAIAQVATMLAPASMIRSMSVMELTNGLDTFLHFSASQWKWLAARHELELRDLNAERRRYGRYGKPGDPVPVPNRDRFDPPVAPEEEERPVPQRQTLTLRRVEPVLPAHEAEVALEPADLPEPAPKPAPVVVGPAPVPVLDPADK